MKLKLDLLREAVSELKKSNNELKEHVKTKEALVASPTEELTGDDNSGLTGGEDIATWPMTVCLAMWDTRKLTVLKTNPQEAQENHVAMVPHAVTLPEANLIFSTRAFSRHGSQLSVVTEGASRNKEVEGNNADLEPDVIG